MDGGDEMMDIVRRGYAERVGRMLAIMSEVADNVLPTILLSELHVPSRVRRILH